MSELIMLPFHDHPMTVEQLSRHACDLCQGGPKPGIVYFCNECNFNVHKGCIGLFLTYPPQCNHDLKVFYTESNENGDRCHYCQQEVIYFFARCTICNITIDRKCVVTPPTRTIFQPKHHKHSLFLLGRLVAFTCNACGVEGDRNPYICIECNLMIHKECIDLPRVISINRHEHRISHTFHLGQGEGVWECGVCRKTIDWVYGAFKCSRCPSGYAVHSRCATRKEVWDGIELEDVPEEDEEIDDPFEVINEKDIIHFSHEEHVLRLDESYYVSGNDATRCGACVLPINNDPFYKCLECDDFSLHKTCARLPRKKNHFLHNHKVILRANKDDVYVNKCGACETYSNGFRYECHHKDTCKGIIKYDVRCSSISEPFHHDLHPHPLYWTLEDPKQCKACGSKILKPLSCIVCEYALCMRCATLPKKIKHRCDDHFLSLCHDAGNSSGDLWCDICETKTDPSVCYYTCYECGVSLHIDCVLGDLCYTKIGLVYPGLEVLPNIGATRPLCNNCKVRCKSNFLMKHTLGDLIRYFCSIGCIPKAK